MSDSGSWRTVLSGEAVDTSTTTTTTPGAAGRYILGGTMVDCAVRTTTTPGGLTSLHIVGGTMTGCSVNGGKVIRIGFEDLEAPAAAPAPPSAPTAPSAPSRWSSSSAERASARSRTPATEGPVRSGGGVSDGEASSTIPIGTAINCVMGVNPTAIIFHGGGGTGGEGGRGGTRRTAHSEAAEARRKALEEKERAIEPVREFVHAFVSQLPEGESCDEFMALEDMETIQDMALHLRSVVDSRAEQVVGLNEDEVDIDLGSVHLFHSPTGTWSVDDEHGRSVTFMPSGSCRIRDNDRLVASFKLSVS